MTHTTESSLPDIQDELSKHILQAQSICSSLICDDHFSCLNKNDLSNIIWANPMKYGLSAAIWKKEQ